MKKIRLITALLGMLALVAACGSAATPATPAKTVKIALVRQLATGDFFQQWQVGAQKEAQRLGVQLQISDASGDNAKQALDLQTAVNAKPDAIIIDHGFPETMDPPIKQALDSGIPVVAFDVDAGDARAVQVEQSDADIAQLGLDRMVKDLNGQGEVLYVYVAGFAPLDRRNDVWIKVKAANPGIKQVAQIGVVNQSIAASVADQAKAALQAHPNVKAVFAPFDEFAKGAVLAINELNLQKQIKVYGADISTADIGVMTATDSPWVATVAADPGNVGAVSVRAAYLKATGGTVPHSVVVPVALITQDALRAGNVQNMQQLAAAVPELETPNLLPVKK